MATIYYAAFDQDGITPIALFRVLEDDEAKTLDIERLTPDGTWLNDPSIIDELQEPEVHLISAADAQAAQTTLLANANAGDDASHADVATAVATPPDPQPAK